jgi:ring-1,2-phenylacetyl-CoA epoxidase subunit PaaC
MTEARAALADLLRRLAEAKHVLGHRLALAGLSAPALEATVATVAMAQEELGHARLLYASEARLRDAAGDRDPGLALEIQTAPPDPALVPPLGDWLDVLAVLATLDAALALWLEALAAHGEAWVASRARRMLDEEAAHRAYADGWLEVVCAAPALRSGLDAALGAARERCAAWMAETRRAAAPLEAAGLLVAPGARSLAAIP